MLLNVDDLVIVAESLGELKVRLKNWKRWKMEELEKMEEKGAHGKR